MSRGILSISVFVLPQKRKRATFLSSFRPLLAQLFLKLCYRSLFFLFSVLPLQWFFIYLGAKTCRRRVPCMPSAVLPPCEFLQMPTGFFWRVFACMEHHFLEKLIFHFIVIIWFLQDFRSDLAGSIHVQFNLHHSDESVNLRLLVCSSQKAKCLHGQQLLHCHRNNFRPLSYALSLPSIWSRKRSDWFSMLFMDFLHYIGSKIYISYITKAFHGLPLLFLGWKLSTPLMG